jgi:DNA-directed RNA polymerase specialized sigma24 family protein
MFTGVQVDPLPGDSTDNRNYIGGWSGAGRALYKGLREDNRDRWTPPKTDRSVKRMKAAQAEAKITAAEAQALAERESAYQAIVWPARVTDLQREAYYLTQVRRLSLSKAGKKMGITKAMVKRHADLAKESI